MPFKLGNTSNANLKGVDESLVEVVRHAITITPIDFTVIEGVRTVHRQAILLRQGKTQTMKSKHIDGLAVDLAPWVGGKPSWDWDHFWPLIDTIRTACVHCAVNVVWGGAWHTLLTNSTLPAKLLNQQYVDLRKSQNRKPFSDGPHIERRDRGYS